MVAEKIDQMNIHEIVTNPTGRYSSYMSARYRIIEDLNNRYNNLIFKHKGFKFNIYKNKENFIFHFKIPSETVEELLYDVVLMFTPPENDVDVKLERTLKNYHVKLFSNSPNFTFTYTYVLNKSDMLVPIMKKKCSDEALNQPPTIRNPVQVYGFEKSCWYACKYIQKNNLLVKFELESNLKLYSEASLLRNVKSDVSKFNEYKMLKNKQNAAKKKTVKKENGETLKNYNKNVNKKSVKKNTVKPIKPKSVIKNKKKK